MRRVLLANATLVIPESGLLDADVLVEGETVAGLFRRGEGPAADEVIDLSGKVIFPGLIEPHAHLGYGTPDDYFTETRAAALGGVTTMMSFNWTREPYDGWLEEHVAKGERQAVVDFAFHLGLMTEEQLAGVSDYYARWGVSSFKFYMHYMGRGGAAKGLDMDEGFLLRVCEAVSRIPGGTLCVHAELPGVVRPYQERVRRTGGDGLRGWADARPPIAEAAALALALRIADRTACPLYVVHLTSREGLEEVARGRGATPLYVETCPHYLSHTADDPMGTLLKVGPPLRESEDREALWEAVLDGRIDVIGSDHIAHTREEKTGSVWGMVGGFQGSGTTLSYLLSEGYWRRGLSLQRIAQLTSMNPARIFGLYPRKGTIRVGSDADLAVVDLDREETVTAAGLHSRADFSPYEGWSLRGWPVMTMCRGRWVHRDRQPVDGTAGWGRYVSRKGAAAR